MPTLAEAIVEHLRGAAPPNKRSKTKHDYDVEDSDSLCENHSALTPRTPVLSQARRWPFLSPREPRHVAAPIQPIIEDALNLASADPSLFDLPDFSDGADIIEIPALEDLLQDYTATIADAELAMQMLRTTAKGRCGADFMRSDSLVSSASKPVQNAKLYEEDVESPAMSA